MRPDINRILAYAVLLGYLKDDEGDTRQSAEHLRTLSEADRAEILADLLPEVRAICFPPPHRRPFRFFSAN